MAAASSAWADSPLTSTEFWPAYQDIPEIAAAAEDGLTERGYQFLISPQTPYDQKAAYINAMGWRFEGMSGEAYFLDIWHSLHQGVKPDTAAVRAAMTPDELFCMAYLTAMSDYFHPEDAFYWMDTQHYEFNEAVRLTFALIHAQAAMDKANGFCLAWRAVERVVTDHRIDKDVFRPQATRAIMNYMESYQSYCN
jgi:hypothetical protein